MNKKIILTCLIFTITFSMNAQNWFGNNEKIKGNGKVATVNRTTSDFDEVAVGGTFDVILVKGKEGNIKIEAEENIIPYIETEVSGNTLKINYKKNTNISTTKKLTITVFYHDIENISLGGSGTISSKEKISGRDFKINLGGSGKIDLHIEAQEIKASIGGSGDINITGNTKDFICSIAGSGSINAYDLKTNEIKATVAGSGSIKTTVKSKINAKIVGSGSLYYKGNPNHIDTKSVGSGSIIDKN